MKLPFDGSVFVLGIDGDAWVAGMANPSDDSPVGIGDTPAEALRDLALVIEEMLTDIDASGTVHESPPPCFVP